MGSKVEEQRKTTTKDRKAQEEIGKRNLELSSCGSMAGGEFSIRP